MNKITTKIYRLDPSNYSEESPKSYVKKLMTRHNNETTNIIYEQVDCTVEPGNFELLLYVHKPSASKPSWYGLLVEITGNNPGIKYIESKYPSFVLFFFNDKEAFVITGGAGYRAVERGFDSQFGFKVVERLIDTSEDELRGLSQRVFLGVELASNRFFKSDYVFEDEDSFGKYYRGLDVYVNSKKLKEIGVETSKKKLLVRGELGFKIDTKISFDALLQRIEKISKLLKEACLVELNPFKKLTRWELKKEDAKGKIFQYLLDQNLVNDYFKEFEACDTREIFHPMLMEYLRCSHIRVKLGKEEKDIPTYQPITPRLIMGFLNIDVDTLRFPRFHELVKEIDIWIVDEESNNRIYPTKMLDWFYGEVSIRNDKYMKFENEWFNYSIKFSNDLNNRLDQLANRIETYSLDNWASEISSETVYNDSYLNNDSFIVGDRILHKGIEIADLISWTNNELFIFHIKDGIDRNLRVLQSQIINSAKVISEFRSNLNSEDLKMYHSRLMNAYSKTDRTIPNLEEFKGIINKKDVKFIFGIATSTSNIQKSDIFSELKKSRSAVAKIAVLHSYYTIKNMEFGFSVCKIVKEISTSEISKNSLITQ